MDEIKVDAASAKDWEILEKHAPKAAYVLGRVIARCVLELRDRVAALEAAAKSAAAPVPASTPAPAGVTVEELADCLPANAWAGPEGYSRQAFARHLLEHPRIGPLLRSEGAPAPKRVVLRDWPPKVSTPLYWNSFVRPHGQAWQEGHTAGWAAARAEVERQQGKQLPQTQEKSNDY